MKKNGFSCPLHWQQILTWVIYSLNIMIFYLFTSIILISDKKFTLSIIFAILSLIVFITGLIATYIDPSDDLLKNEIKKRKKMEKYNQKYILEISKHFDFCVICCTNIHSTSKHCRVCDRCVDNFDHHCNWLNNCIGDKNYFYFFTLLIVVFFDLCYSVAVLFYSFSLFINRNFEENEEMTKLSNLINITPTTSAIISFIFAVLDFGILINITYLIIIHSWLRCHDLTTYEYIVKYLSNVQEEENKNTPNDNSDNVELNLNLNENKKRMRNKIVPKDLMEKIKNAAHENLDMIEKSDLIIINEKDYNNKIFRPILDDIYNSKNEKKTQREETNLSHKDFTGNLNLIPSPKELRNSKKVITINHPYKKCEKEMINNYINNDI